MFFPAFVALRIQNEHCRDGVVKELCLESPRFLLLAMAFETLGATYMNDLALHLSFHYSPSMPMACDIYVCRLA